MTSFMADAVGVMVPLADGQEMPNIDLKYLSTIPEDYRPGLLDIWVGSADEWCRRRGIPFPMRKVNGVVKLEMSLEQAQESLNRPEGMRDGMLAEADKLATSQLELEAQVTDTTDDEDGSSDGGSLYLVDRYVNRSRIADFEDQDSDKEGVIITTPTESTSSTDGMSAYTSSCGTLSVSSVDEAQVVIYHHPFHAPRMVEIQDCAAITSDGTHHEPIFTGDNPQQYGVPKESFFTETEAEAKPPDFSIIDGARIRSEDGPYAELAMNERIAKVEHHKNMVAAGFPTPFSQLFAHPISTEDKEFARTLNKH